MCQRDYRLQSFLSIQYVHGDLCKHLGIDSSTDHPHLYSNLFLNVYINQVLMHSYVMDTIFHSGDAWALCHKI